MLHSFCIIALLVVVVSATPGRFRPLDALPEFHTSPSGFVFSPYKDITADCDWNTLKMRSDATGKTLPITQAMPARNNVLTWAFATGECGAENWGGMEGAKFGAANVPDFVSAGKQYIISTGGEAGSFTCATDSGFSAFIARYNSSNMIGIDFDIEAGQSIYEIDDLITRVKNAQPKFPKWRFSFTLATLAQSNGSNVAHDFGPASPDPLGAIGTLVMQRIKAQNLQNYFINLMTMDYGTGSDVCVMSGGACEMGQSAIQAAMNLRGHWGVPYSWIELTPMSGVNDVSSNDFTLGNAQTMDSWVRSAGIAGVHFWSFDRDKGLTFTNKFVGDLGL